MLTAEAAHPVAPGEANGGHEDGGEKGQEHAEGELPRAGFGGEPSIAAPVGLRGNEVREIVGGEKPVAGRGRHQEIRERPLRSKKTCERGRAENGGLLQTVRTGEIAADEVKDD